MSKNTRNRILLTAVAALLLVAVTVGGTMAWLTASTKEVMNTFTTSNIKITLDETLPANKTAKMVPGNDIAKDPYVTLDAPSEESYLYVEIVEADAIDCLSFTVSSDWVKMENAKAPHGGVMYYYKDAVTASTDKYYILTGKTGTDSANASLENGFVHVNDKITDEQMNPTDSTFTNPTLTFYAYAIQTANTGTQTEAWNSLMAQDYPNVQ